MGGISIGSSIGQAVGSIYSAWESGKTAKYVAAKQAEIAEYNRRGAQLAAETAYIAGAGQIAKITMEAGAIRGAQRTAYASRGVTGSSMKEVMASSEVMKRIDVATAKMNAMQAAWGYKTQAAGFAAQAANGSYMGSYMQTFNRMKGFDSALGQATEVADKWYKYFGSASVKYAG
jgi:hypothetical protein